MSSENLLSELISLTKDTREQIAYLHELGVENVETARLSTESEVFPGRSQTLPSASAQRLHGEHLTSITTIKTQGGSVQKQTTTSLPQVALFADMTAPPPIIKRSSETFEEIHADIGDCTRCPLYQGRTNIVHTEGNRNARLMFVGEAPGADEDAQARPFVGRAGQLLTKIIEAIGFKREEVLIGNVNRCRPPGNRPPTQDEALMCKPFLLREIAAVQPEVIVVLGNTAMKNLLDTKQGITRLRGEFQDYQGVKVMPTFHPAYLLRDPSKKQETWQDLKQVRDYLETTAKRPNQS
jgi:uracil-DNA glycosylase family 4